VVCRDGLVSALSIVGWGVLGLCLIAPLGPWPLYLFSAAIGPLWLSAVPLANALVGQRWGVQHLGLLGGVVFFGHQIGSFLGAWLGGRFFDTFGNYDYAWAMVIAFGLFAALVHAPIDQRPITQPRMPAPA